MVTAVTTIPSPSDVTNTMIRSPTGVRRLSNRFRMARVGPHHRFAGGDFSDDPEEGRQGNQQDQRGGQHACRAWMRGVEIARDPLGHPVLTPGEAFDDGRMGVGKQWQDNQDQPAAEHHRQKDDDQESAEHQGQPSADLADGIKCGTCNDTGGRYARSSRQRLR